MYYTTSGTITLCRWPFGAQVAYRAGIYRFCALSWLITKITETNGQQNIIISMMIVNAVACYTVI